LNNGQKVKCIEKVRLGGNQLLADLCGFSEVSGRIGRDGAIERLG